MSTTTIRISEELKDRLAAVAERAGTSAHGLIVQAIEEKVRREELDAQFQSVANERWATFLKDGRSIPWSDAKHYLVAKAGGKSPRKPAPRKLTR